MDTYERIPAPPKLPAPQREPDPDYGGGWGVVLAALFGLIAWAGAFAAWATAQDRGTDVPADNYVLAIGLTIVGATLLIISAISNQH